MGSQEFWPTYWHVRVIVTLPLVLARHIIASLIRVSARVCTCVPRRTRHIHLSKKERQTNKIWDLTTWPTRNSHFPFHLRDYTMWGVFLFLFCSWNLCQCHGIYLEHAEIWGHHHTESLFACTMLLWKEDMHPVTTSCLPRVEFSPKLSLSWWCTPLEYLTFACMRTFMCAHVRPWTCGWTK